MVRRELLKLSSLIHYHNLDRLVINYLRPVTSRVTSTPNNPWRESMSSLGLSLATLKLAFGCVYVSIRQYYPPSDSPSWSSLSASCGDLLLFTQYFHCSLTWVWPLTKTKAVLKIKGQCAIRREQEMDKLFGSASGDCCCSDILLDWLLGCGLLVGGSRLVGRSGGS